MGAEQPDRNAEIVRLHASGVSARDIADRLDLSRERVHQILRRCHEKAAGIPAKKRPKYVSDWAPFPFRHTGAPPITLKRARLEHYREDGVPLDRSRLWYVVRDGRRAVYAGESYGDALIALSDTQPRDEQDDADTKETT